MLRAKCNNFILSRYDRIRAYLQIVSGWRATLSLRTFLFFYHMLVRKCQHCRAIVLQCNMTEMIFFKTNEKINTSAPRIYSPRSLEVNRYSSKFYFPETVPLKRLLSQFCDPSLCDEIIQADIILSFYACRRTQSGTEQYC